VLVTKACTKDKIEGILSFCRLNPWKPYYHPDTYSGFLALDTSDLNLVIDVHDEKGRVGTGMVTEISQYKGNYTPLEIFGTSGDPDKAYQAVEMIISIAKQKLPAQYRGFAIPFHETFFNLSSILQRNQLTSLFTAQKHLFQIPPKKDGVLRDKIRGIESHEHAEVYEILLASFREEIISYLPKFDIWKSNLVESNKTKVFTYRENEKIVGVCEANIYDSTRQAEIAYFAIVPEWRKKNIAGQLFEAVTNDLSAKGYSEMWLWVNPENIGAIKFWKKMGWNKQDEFTWYIWNRN
jgi:ribosomal protein S18 acetylase RimI-like enzyme